MNAFNCTMSITKIPQYSVKSVSVSSVGGIPTSTRATTRATSTQKKATKTSTTVKASGTAKIGTPTTLNRIDSMKNLISQKNSHYVNSDGSTKMEIVNAKLKECGVTTSAESLGINKHGATSQRFGNNDRI